MTGRTTIDIARRFSTNRNADAIAVVSEGRVIEAPLPHSELVKFDGPFLVIRPYISRHPSLPSASSGPRPRQAPALLAADEKTPKAVSASPLLRALILFLLVFGDTPALLHSVYWTYA